MALFCDFENVALGVRDANDEKFDIKRVLERLLLKGSIVVKKAYCDWGRYKDYKATMHEASFELIDIPHVRQSGKNSADIRLVVDALDLCYTKSHVDTFVIISGDSDFSPLVSKLRENNKQVIGVGVKQSTSDLLITNCDEFIFYDDLVRESQRAAARREQRAPQAGQAQGQSARREERRKDDVEARRTKAIDLAVETFDALASERGDGGRIWASMLKEAIKRRRPDFNESYFGFRAFGNLLEAAQERGLLAFDRDEKSGTYVYRPTGVTELLEEPETATDMPRDGQAPEAVAATTPAPASEAEDTGRRGRGGRQRGRGQGREARENRARESAAEPQAVQPQVDADPIAAAPEPVPASVAMPAPAPFRSAPAVVRGEDGAPLALRQSYIDHDAVETPAQPEPEPVVVAPRARALPVDGAPGSALGNVPMPTSRGDMQLTETPAPAKRARKQPARLAKAAARAEAAKAPQAPVNAVSASEGLAPEAAAPTITPAADVAATASQDTASAASGTTPQGTGRSTRGTRRPARGQAKADAAPASEQAEAIGAEAAPARGQTEVDVSAAAPARGRAKANASARGKSRDDAPAATPARAQGKADAADVAQAQEAAAPSADDAGTPAKAARKSAPRRPRRPAAKAADAG